MNKRIIFFGMSILVLLACGVACKKDHSTLDLNKLPGVVIDTAGNGALSVFQFDHLVVQPALETDLPDSRLSYRWKINLVPDDTTYEVIGTERNLDYEVKFKPNQSDDYHQLWYTVTDNETGLEYIMTWPVTVKNNIGEGLVIAETNDNANTDLSHIMSPEVTTGFSGQSVKHNVYSSLNGNRIAGKVKQMRFATIFRVNALLAITDNSMVRVNTLDYTFGGMNADLFYSGIQNIQPQALGEIYQHTILISDGKLTGTILGGNRKFGAPFDFKFIVPDQVAMNPNTVNADHPTEYEPAVRINFYDEVNGHFVYQPSFYTFADYTMHKYPSVNALPFNPGDLPGMQNLAAGISVDKGFLHVLKNKTTGEIGLYIFDGGVAKSPSPDQPQPVGLHDLTAAPEIANARHFVLLEDQKVLYYATDTKIYAVMYSTSTPVFEERYTVAAGEAITTLQLYTQVGYPFSPTYIATNNKQLIMSTYGTEGKVYLLPMINQGLGNIDAAHIKTFGGFDRITAITPQK